MAPAATPFQMFEFFTDPDLLLSTTFLSGEFSNTEMITVSQFAHDYLKTGLSGFACEPALKEIDRRLLYLVTTDAVSFVGIEFDLEVFLQMRETIT